MRTRYEVSRPSGNGEGWTSIELFEDPSAAIRKAEDELMRMDDNDGVLIMKVAL